MQGIWWTYLIANPLGHMLGGRHTVPYRAIQMVVCKAERYQPLSKLYPLRIHSPTRRLVGLQSYPHYIGFFLTENPFPTVDGRNPYKESHIFAKVKAGYLSSTAEPHSGDNYYSPVHLHVLDRKNQEIRNGCTVTLIAWSAFFHKTTNLTWPWIWITIIYH